MSISTEIGKLVGSGAGEFVSKIADIIDKFVETEEEKKAAEVLLMKIQQEPDKWQAEINKIEAAHRTIFVAGWRPFIGWVCGVGLGMNFIIFPLIEWIAKFIELPVTRPDIDTGSLITLVISLLGLSATRTYEKMKGVAK